MTPRRLILSSVAVLSAIFALAACSSGVPTGSPGQGQVSEVPSSASGESPGSPLPAPSLSSVDPILAARFPATIGGQPVTNVQTYNFLDTLTASRTPKTIIDHFNASASGAGINPRSVTLGRAQVTVGGKSVFIEALRSPGGDAKNFLQPLTAVARLRDIGARASPRAISPSPQDVGGKSVQVASSADLTQYYYPTGDTVFILTNLDAATAATILTGLP